MTFDRAREWDDRRALIDAKLTELGLYAKELCPEGAVEMSTVRYEEQNHCAHGQPEGGRTL